MLWPIWPVAQSLWELPPCSCRLRISPRQRQCMAVRQARSEGPRPPWSASPSRMPGGSRPRVGSWDRRALRAEAGRDQPKTSWAATCGAKDLRACRPHGNPGPRSNWTRLRFRARARATSECWGRMTGQETTGTTGTTSTVVVLVVPVATQEPGARSDRMVRRALKGHRVLRAVRRALKGHRVLRVSKGCPERKGSRVPKGSPEFRERSEPRASTVCPDHKGRPEIRGHLETRVLRVLWVLKGFLGRSETRVLRVLWVLKGFLGRSETRVLRVFRVFRVSRAL